MAKLQVTLRYYSSKKPPTVLIELPIHVAEKLTDGHENITVNLFDDIRKAIEHAKPALAEQPVRITEQDAREIATKFFCWWHNRPGSNTMQGFVEWIEGEGSTLLDKLNANREPSPDVSALVEALEDIAGAHHHSASAGDYFAKIAREALAAHRKGGE